MYVDVGYLLAAVATRVTGSSLRRGVQTDYAVLIEALQAQAEADSGLPLLRVNWYDAGGRPGGMPDLSQDEIGLLPRVKLRLGRLSYSGEQKGVDVRIGLDLAIQARQRVADVVYLVSGDDDLTEAVEEAQGQGVQVVLLVVPRHDGRPLAVAKHLAREVDRTIVIDPAAIDAAVRSRAVPEALVPDALFDVDAGVVAVGGVGDGVGSVAVGGVKSTEAQPNEEQVECAPGAGAPGFGDLPRGRRRVTRLAHRFDAGSPDGAVPAT
ncbi:MAG: NYN domain-containing protein, partial [Micrococcales bacterium]|nr:NYN domain-containing protein [Micrococcales bacterium]